MRPAALLFVLLLAVPAAALPPPAPETSPAPAAAGPLNLPTETLLGGATQAVTNATGENITREDIRVVVDMDFRTFDFDLVGVIFGGGTFQAQARIAARLEIRAISVSRVEAALQEGTGGAVNLSQLGVNASRQFLTADEFRAALAGEALAAFEAEQERRTSEFLAQAFPDLIVLSSRFAWSNTDPKDNTRGDPPAPAPAVPPRTPGPSDLPRLKDPPIVLDAVLDVQYLERASLVGLLEDAWARRQNRSAQDEVAESQEEQLLERLRAQNEGAFYERSAFSQLGITQVITPQVESGWDMILTVTLPEGYTIEYASPDVLVGPDAQRAETYVLARESGVPLSNPVAVALSNRFLITVALFAGVMLAGTLLRVPVIVLANRRAKP